MLAELPNGYLAVFWLAVKLFGGVWPEPQLPANQLGQVS